MSALRYYLNTLSAPSSRLRSKAVIILLPLHLHFLRPGSLWNHQFESINLNMVTLTASLHKH